MTSIRDVANNYDNADKDTLSTLVEILKVYMTHDNPKFDGIKFRKACGL